MTPTITVNMDKKCSFCGKGGAVAENRAGLCMSCIVKAIRAKNRRPKK
jgi:NMD protein affecting ribosome stability and mRNA decay